MQREVPGPHILLRLATAADANRVRTLAELDSARVPTGEVLLAEVDGRLRAALSLDSGHAVADPFHRTADLVRLLRISSDQLIARDAPAITTLSALGRRSTDLRSTKPLAALRRLA